MADSRAEEWCKRHSRAFEKMNGWHTLAQELAEAFFPERASFMTEIVGDEYYRTKYDGTPIMMRWRLGNAIGAMSRGRGREWFSVQHFPIWLNEDDAVASWNQDATDVMRSVFYDPRAKAAPALTLSDQDYATFGWSPIKITENKDANGVLFRCYHPKDVAPEANEEGDIDVTHERLCLTGRVLLRKFGERGDLPQKMRRAAEKAPLDDFHLQGCIFPVDEYEPSKRKRPPPGAKFVALYLDPDSERVVQEEYFYTFPWVHRRWLQAIAGSPVALSPCAMVALADAHMSQDIGLTLIEAMQKAADPPVQIAGSSIEGPLDLAPSGQNYINRRFDFRNGDAIRKIETGAMPQYALEFQKGTREYLGQAWLVNLLTLPQDRQLTAYEAERILDQDAREAAPIFEPMENDNAAMMSRTYSIADRWRSFLPRPPKLSKAEVRYDFETPVSLALKRLRSQQAMQAVAVVERFGALELSFGKTRAYKRVDVDRMLKDAVRGIGPQNWIRDDREAEPDLQQVEAAQGLQDAMAMGGQAMQLQAASQALALPAPAQGGQPAPNPATVPAV